GSASRPQADPAGPGAARRVGRARGRPRWPGTSRLPARAAGDRVRRWDDRPGRHAPGLVDPGARAADPPGAPRAPGLAVRTGPRLSRRAGPHPSRLRTRPRDRRLGQARPVRRRMNANVRANRDLWDAWTKIHLGSAFYDVASFRNGERPIRL